jgi:adenylate cyclase
MQLHFKRQWATILLSMFFICLHYGVQAQTLADFENNARAVGGKDRLIRLLEVTEMALREQAYDKAYDLANETADYADKINEPLLRARALHLSGRALMNKSQRKGLFGKERPAQYFRKSIEIMQRNGAPGDPLVLTNLEELRKLAEKNNRTAEITQLDQEISQLKERYKGSTRGGLRKEVAMLNQTLAKEKLSGDSSKIMAAKRLEESQSLQALLAEKEALLSQMNEGQMKVEYMLLQQRQVLDSLLYRSQVDALMLSNQNLALSQAEASRNLSYVIAAILFLLLGVIAYSLFKTRQNSRVLSEKNRIIETERERSEKLLLNVLPSDVAEELKQKGGTSARFYEDVSVLFADFVNFTKIAERITPQQLVSDLDTCFRAFDDIMGKYGLEKIKTIGDAYLSAGGLQSPSPQTVQMVNAAREMQTWLTNWNKERAQQNLPEYHARIGIHQGPLVAGVVGARKFAFDIWGDTVNIAARIEQAGEPDKINLSGRAYEALAGQVACTYRGKLPAKNKGEIDMFFVED